VLLCAAPVAQAQQAPPIGQVTPRTLRPPTPPAAGFAVPASTPEKVPPGAEKLSVIIGNVVVDGGFAELAAATEALIAPFRGKRTTVAAFYQLASDIEKLYAAKGYLLARLTIPPQQMVDRGTMHLKLVAGFFEKIDVSRLPERYQALVRARTAGLIGDPKVTTSKVERSLLIAGELPGLTLRSVVARGDEPGGTQLVLEGTYKPVTASLTTDNRQTKAYRTYEANLQVAMNNVLSSGEQFYASASVPTDLRNAVSRDPVRRVAGGGAVIPIGADGLSFNPEYTVAITNPDPLGGPKTHSHLDRFVANLSYPFIKSRATTLSGKLAFEANDTVQDAPDFNVDLSHDRLRILRGNLALAQSFDPIFPALGGASLELSSTFSRGLLVWGTRTQADALASGVPLSRVGEDPQFSKVDAALRASQGLPLDFVIGGMVAGQYSFNKVLPSSEEFALDGQTALSSFETGTLIGDSGYTVRGEFSRPFAIAAGSQQLSFTPYVFGAIGRAWIVQATALELAEIRAADYGAGVRMQVFTPAIGTTTNFSVEAGRQKTNRIFQPDATKVMFTASGAL
jgi:hemolysin activation/secretion protein